MDGRPRKEAAFLRSLYHKAIAVNQWRNQSHPPISALCTCCQSGVPECLKHCFFECDAAAGAWEFAFTILYHAAQEPQASMPWPKLEWPQCLLGAELPPQLQSTATLWALIRGVVVWTIWIWRNAAIFANDPWSPERVERMIWDGVLDLARMVWDHTFQRGGLQQVTQQRTRRQFIRIWALTDIFCTVNNEQVRWNHRAPIRGRFR